MKSFILSVLFILFSLNPCQADDLKKSCLDRPITVTVEGHKFLLERRGLLVRFMPEDIQKKKNFDFCDLDEIGNARAFDLGDQDYMIARNSDINETFPISLAIEYFQNQSEYELKKVDEHLSLIQFDDKQLFLRRSDDLPFVSTLQFTENNIEKTAVFACNTKERGKTFFGLTECIAAFQLENGLLITQDFKPSRDFSHEFPEILTNMHTRYLELKIED